MDKTDMRALLFEAHLRMMRTRGGKRLMGEDERFELLLDRARAAYNKSLIGSAFPSFWAEAPLAGDPGFDVHVYFDRGQLKPGDHFLPGAGFGKEELFDWYIRHEKGGVGLGFAHDISSGADPEPAVYVNVNMSPLQSYLGFFRAAGCSEDIKRYRSLAARIPKGWETWYVGLFPQRPGSPLRLGNFVDDTLTRAYAQTPELLREHFKAAGIETVTDEMLDTLQKLAQTGLGFEFQVDLDRDGRIGDTVSLSLHAKTRGRDALAELFAKDGAAHKAFTLLEGLSVVDERWQDIPSASFAKGVPISAGDGERGLAALTCMPIFYKVKWESGVAKPAKVYFQCAAMPLGDLS